MADRRAGCPPEDRLVELALGQLAGRDRAEVLEHISVCPACAQEVDGLLAVTERLWLGGAPAEPPAGFESAVLARIGPPADPVGRRRPAPIRGRAAIRAVAAAAALALVFLLGTTVAPRGTSVAEARMVAPSGRAVGVVWHYEDDPSWVFLSVPAWNGWDPDSGDGAAFALLATMADGSTEDLGAITFHGEHGSWATATDLDPDDMEALSVVDSTGRVWCTGTF
jgi:hypothetical protein